MSKKAHSKPAEQSDDGLRVKIGDHGDVWLFGEAREEYEALEEKTDINSIKEFRAITRYLERFATHGTRGLDEKMFKPQGRRKVHGTEVLIHEFKSYQFRIYGVVGQRGGKRCYYGTACDPSKKKDKADPQKLQKAAEEYVRIING